MGHAGDLDSSALGIALSPGAVGEKELLVGHRFGRMRSLATNRQSPL